MTPTNRLSRRTFMQIGAGTLAAGSRAKFNLLEPAAMWGAGRTVAPSDRVRFASIGTGTRGCELLAASIEVPGVECVAVCDLYDSRHEAALEALKKQVPVTRNYREILDNKDIDAVIVAVPGPPTPPRGGGRLRRRQRRLLRKAHVAHRGRRVRDGRRDAETQPHRAGRQPVPQFHRLRKAKEIFESGALGQVTAVEACMDRNDASGAWVYPIPPDASEQTIDWNQFLGDAPKRPSIPSVSSAGAVSAITARACPATSTCTC